jgi:ABC-2 type transport system ATP-binding protein
VLGVTRPLQELSAHHRGRAGLLRGRRNEIVGLLGPNGAGKTTTINMIWACWRRPPAPSHRRNRHREAPFPGAGPHEFRGRVCNAARQSHGHAEPALLRDHLCHRGPREPDRDPAREVRPPVATQHALRTAVLRRADPGRARQGAAEPAGAAVAGRAHRLPRSRRGPDRAPADPRARPRRELRHLMDLPQHVRSRGGLRPGAVPVARKILLEGDPRALPAQHGAHSLEELFIQLAREPLHAAEGRPQ